MIGLVVLYLVAIVAANLSVTFFGPQFAVINSFVFIGLDITTRDALHDRWHGKNLWRNMALLILAGSALSAMVNWQAAPIAVASCAAFGVAALADTLTYTLLGKRAFLVRCNGSNVTSAIIDSVVFCVLAFGFPILWNIILLSIVSKWLGGFVWSFVVYRIRAWKASRASTAS